MEDGDSHASDASSLSTLLKTWRMQLIFVALSCGYYFIFKLLGFNFANLIFLLVSLPLAGVAKGQSVQRKMVVTILTSIITTLILWALAYIMDFNIPVSSLGI